MSPTLSNPPSPLLLSPSNTQSSSYARRTNVKQLLPTDSKSHIIKLDPAPPRRPLSVSIDNDEGVSFKGKNVQSTSYSTGDGKISYSSYLAIKTSKRTRKRLAVVHLLSYNNNNNNNLYFDRTFNMLYKKNNRQFFRVFFRISSSTSVQIDVFPHVTNQPEVSYIETKTSCGRWSEHVITRLCEWPIT